MWVPAHTLMLTRTPYIESLEGGLFYGSKFFLVGAKKS
jgi:hypothetical protein